MHEPRKSEWPLRKKVTKLYSSSFMMATHLSMVSRQISRTMSNERQTPSITSLSARSHLETSKFIRIMLPSSAHQVSASCMPYALFMSKRYAISRQVEQERSRHERPHATIHSDPGHGIGRSCVRVSDVSQGLFRPLPSRSTF